MTTRRPVDVLPDRTAGDLGRVADRAPRRGGHLPGPIRRLRRRRPRRRSRRRAGRRPMAPVAQPRRCRRDRRGRPPRRPERARPRRPPMTTPQPPSPIPAGAGARPETPAGRTHPRALRHRPRPARAAASPEPASRRQLRLDPQTVRRFADATSIDDLLVNTGRRDSLIDAFRPYLHQRWNEGCTDATVLYQEIRQLGFTGSDKTVRRYVHPFRATDHRTPTDRRAAQVPPRRPLDHDRPRQPRPRRPRPTRRDQPTQPSHPRT